jgi:hypothetical protein
MNKRTFTAKEIATLLTSQAGSDIELNLGNGLRAVRMATKDRPVFQIDRAGKDLHNLDDADPAELAELSAIVWTFADQFGPTEDALEEPLTPERFKDKPEPENIEPDPLGLTPDHLRGIIADPGLARRLAAGTATAEDLIVPDALKDEPDDSDPLAYPGDASI